MATTRLRRTFRYPHDSDSDDPPDLDEEHQESLLKDLQTQDEATSTLYRHIFLALPLLTSLAYTPTLVAASNNTSALLALLEIFVPALAAYVLYRYPVGLPVWRGYSVFFVVFGADEDPQGVQPYEREIVGFGGVLASILGVMGVVWWWKGAGEEGLWVGLPGVVYFLTLFVRQQLAPVDLEELRKARYELKGA